MMTRTWAGYLAWLAIAAVVGGGTAFLFADVLEWPRRVYLVPYAVAVSALVHGYLRWCSVGVFGLVRQRWRLGVIGAIAVGAFVVGNILSQPASPHSRGFQLVVDLLWLGMVYGTLDALLLSIIPVHATWCAMSALGWTESWLSKSVAAALSLAASVLVTAVYHLGYPEYRSLALVGPVFGNTVMSLAYLVTRSPLAAIGSHVAMHVAGVLHGPETVMQLPPHY